MSNSLKPKNNNYLDSSGIVHNQELLSDLLNKSCFVHKQQSTGETIDISKKLNTDSDRSFLIVVFGAHYNSNHHTLKFYILRVRGEDYNLYLVYDSHGGNINLSLTYNHSNKTLTVTNSGTYGCQYGVVLI